MELDLKQVLAANERYNRDLQRHVKGTFKRTEVFNLGNSFGELSKHIGSQDLYMRQGILTKAQRGHSTTIALKQLENLPLKLSQASQIFKSKQPNSFVAVIHEMDSSSNPVVVAINTQHKEIEGNATANISAITSIHGREIKQLKQWEMQGLEVYNRGKKEALTSSKGLGAIPSVEGGKGSNDATKVAQENQNSKSFAEKMADLTKKNTEALQVKNGSPRNNKHKGKSL